VTLEHAHGSAVAHIVAETVSSFRHLVDDSSRSALSYNRRRFPYCPLGLQLNRLDAAPDRSALLVAPVQDIKASDQSASDAEEPYAGSSCIDLTVKANDHSCDTAWLDRATCYRWVSVRKAQTAGEE
jgi:hypothetical protein